jgi:hypothetical protein
MSKKEKTTEEEEVKKTPKGGVSKITFTIRDRDGKNGKSERVFDEATHGEDFAEIADTFAESEKREILNRKDE